MLTLAACNVGATPAPTVDVNAINTAAFTTAMAQISAQQTQSALAAPATPLPTNTSISLATSAVASPTGNAGGVLPTVSFNTTPNTTPLAGLTQIPTSLPPTSSGQVGTASGCNDAALIGETLPDKSVVDAGKAFNKAWDLKNTGTCTWDDGYIFAFQASLSSSAIVGYDIVIDRSKEIIKPGHDQSFIVKLTAPTTPGEYKGYWKLQSDDGSLFGPLVFFDVIVE